MIRAVEAVQGLRRVTGQKNIERKRSVRVVVAAVLACAVIAVAVWFVSAGRANRQGFDHLLPDDQPIVVLDETVEAQVEAFCGDCHALPRAESFPRYAWYDKALRGYEFYAQSGRNDLRPPPIYQTVAYYRARAPEQLVFPDPRDAETELRAQFVVEKLTVQQHREVPHGIAHLRWTRLQPDSAPVLLACDMFRGNLTALDLRNGVKQPRILARLHHPCHVEPCDLDGDGTLDLVVADLGSFPPLDHDRGRVVWLRARGASGTYDEIVLASGLGRVADVRPLDLHGDGDTDLIVAEFGMYLTGGVLLLNNVAGAGKSPRFEQHILDRRPGTIHVPVHDLNADGRPDFVALVSQEYEQVEAFINQGKSQFDVQTLWTGPDLAFGSSGIELVDLDGDDDEDILYSNGDAFDNSFVNPSHGVQWLENLGDLQFAYHRLADLTGAYRALANDIDLDGDRDVIVGAWIPGNVEPANALDRPLASILCLEQTSRGEFLRHTLEEDSLHHAAMEIADFDGDGDPDFAVGSHSLSHTRRLPYWLAIWWNQVND
jgi:hypothetical protein